MNNKHNTETGAPIQSIMEEIGAHLRKALELMDSVEPDSIFGARLQQLIDEVDDGSRRYDSRFPK